MSQDTSSSLFPISCGHGPEAARRLEPYPDPDRPGVVRLPVASNKYPEMEALVDADALPLVQGRRWNFSCGSYGRGMSVGAVVLSGKNTPLARIIMGVVDDADRQVSHLNGDKLDCRRANLIVRTRSEVAKARKPSPETVARLTPYADPDRPGVWRVPLRGYRAYREVLIDAADLSIVRGKNWNWAPRGEDDDGRTDGVVLLATTARHLPLHRMIAGVTDPRTRVVFVNGDALDCRRANLVVRTQAETVQSTRKPSTRAGRACTSAFKGVCLDPDRGQWVVQIRKGRVGMNVGRFNTELDAAVAYDALARVVFGEHAHLNFPDQPSTEAAIAEARSAVQSAVDKRRAERRRQRDVERELRRAAADLAKLEPTASDDDDATMIPGETARQLFDVIPTVWERWQRFHWLGMYVTGDDGQRSYPIAHVARLLRRCGIIALPYPDPQRAGVYRVPLSGETAQGREALIDADAVPLVQTRRWRFAPSKVGRGGEVQTMIPTENIRLHYVVMGMDSDGEHHLGHRNDDPLDCRRANLVVRTLTDTAANKRKQGTICGRPCSSRFKGVWWNKRDERWVAQIKKNRVQRRLGSFRDEIAAAQAYDEAARELFGEHARLNFPDGVDAWLEAEAARIADALPSSDAAAARVAA